MNTKIARASAIARFAKVAAPEARVSHDDRTKTILPVLHVKSHETGFFRGYEAGYAVHHRPRHTRIFCHRHKSK